jgi:hypothetical protein
MQKRRSFFAIIGHFFYDNIVPIEEFVGRVREILAHARDNIIAHSQDLLVIYYCGFLSYLCTPKGVYVPIKEFVWRVREILAHARNNIIAHKARKVSRQAVKHLGWQNGRFGGGTCAGSSPSRRSLWNFCWCVTVFPERLLFVLLELPFCVLRSLSALACPAMCQWPLSFRSAQMPVLRSPFCVLTLALALSLSPSLSLLSLM